MKKEVNAVIESVSLRMERGFILSSYIHIHDGSYNQSFGGYALYLNKSAKHHELKSCAGHWIARVMEIAGVEDWKDLKGKSIRIIRNSETWGATIIGIGHIVKDDWFYPEEDFKEQTK